MGQPEWWAAFKIFQDRDSNYYWQLQRPRQVVAVSGRAYQGSLVRAEVNWLARRDLIMVYGRAGEPRQDQEPRYGSWRSSTHPRAG